MLKDIWFCLCNKNVRLRLDALENTSKLSPAEWGAYGWLCSHNVNEIPEAQMVILKKMTKIETIKDSLEMLSLMLKK